MPPPDTIVALSSPPGASARAVVRLSGPRARELAARVVSPLPRASWRWAEGALQLPGWPPAPVTALMFRAPRSYTGEDVVELWVPGAPPLVRRLLLTLEEAGARLAEPGEFTRRAFLGGRLDLTQVEAVLALTTSEDQAHARAALRALEGGTGARIDELKGALLDVLAHVEAAIDFSEEDLDLASAEELERRLGAAADLVAGLRGGAGARPQAGAEPVVVLWGPANAGKSTLFNVLTGATGADGGGALVSAEAGTTRDVVEGRWSLSSRGMALRVRLRDTAGAKPVQGAIEALALSASQEAARGADLVLVLVDGREVDASSSRLAELLGLLEQQAPGAPRRVLLTKQDLAPGGGAPPDVLRVSAHTGQGLDALAAAVADALFGAGPGALGGDLFGSARQDGLLRAASEAIARARELVRGDDPARAELAAVDLGEALERLGQLTGEVSTEDLLGRIFSSFCVGK